MRVANICAQAHQVYKQCKQMFAALGWQEWPRALRWWSMAACFGCHISTISNLCTLQQAQI